MSVMTRNTNLHLHLMPRACLTVETPEKTYSTVGACSCLPPVQTSIVEVSTTLEQAGTMMPPQFPPSKYAEKQPFFRVLGLSTSKLPLLWASMLTTLGRELRPFPAFIFLPTG